MPSKYRSTRYETLKETKDKILESGEEGYEQDPFGKRTGRRQKMVEAKYQLRYAIFEKLRYGISVVYCLN